MFHPMTLHRNQGCGSGMIYSGSGSDCFIFGLRIRLRIRLFYYIGRIRIRNPDRNGDVNASLILYFIANDLFIDLISKEPYFYYQDRYVLTTGVPTTSPIPSTAVYRYIYKVNYFRRRNLIALKVFLVTMAKGVVCVFFHLF